jgi:non-ribosomal peptide synthetase component F
VPPPAPLFSSLFNYRYNTPREQRNAHSGIEVLHATESTNYPLAMAVEDSSTEFTLIALAQAGADANRICAYFNQALSSLVERLEHQPASSVRALQVLPKSEQEEVIDRFNQTAHKFDDGTLDALFCAQASSTPDAVAVVDVDGKEMTYAQLDFDSTELAEWLVSRKVEEGAS